MQSVLARAAGGVVFTTIQKFAPPAGQASYPVLTRRRNVVVIADEAHRNQYGFSARVGRRTGEMAYGFAKYLRDAPPNARARLRVLVKRVLRRYGYPPDLQDAAVQTVLKQAEALSAAWAV